MAILSCHVSIKLPPKISDGQTLFYHQRLPPFRFTVHWPLATGPLATRAAVRRDQRGQVVRRPSPPTV